jgi:Transglycosylase SLT domain
MVQEAAAHGVPPALVDAVVRIESRYDPAAVGSVGEVGLMQVRPKTAALLGFRGSPAELAEPQTNLRYGVAYLAKAWRLAGGDLCRALMKYRAGHGSETMSALSIEYCRRARLHLVAAGTELGTQTEALAIPSIREQKHPVRFRRTERRTATAAVQRRHHLSLSRRAHGIAVANKARITSARVRMATPQKPRAMRLVDQAPPRALKHQRKASGTWVAYR